MARNYFDRKPLVPVIRKRDFDVKASEFLAKYCPEALDNPMPVPIGNIARKKMGLLVLTDYRLTEDFSILGQMCFTKGVVPIYDKMEDEFRDLRVRPGTMFIDPDTYFIRNLGSVNNTTAHECVHWEEHRLYFMSLPAASSSNSSSAIACRCPAVEKDETTQQEWSDIDWIEWQANGIAPRILMPYHTFPRVISEIKKRYTQRTGDHSADVKAIARRVADFYNVSMQSAAIRMAELDVRV